MDPDKRERIIDAAADAFSRLGFKRASVDQIAQAAGVAKGTVYLYSRSKEDLFYQAVHRDLRRWLGQVAEMLDPRLQADELLRRVAVASVRYLASHPLVRDLVFGIYHGELPGWAERYEQLRALAHANVVEILRLGVSQGCFRGDIDIEQVASIIQDFQHAGAMLAARLGRFDIEVLTRRLETGLDLLLNGLRPRST